MTARKIFFLVLLAGWSGMAMAQSETTEKKARRGRPDIPGTFLIDLGFNFPSEGNGFNTGIFGSKTVNLYYQYDKRLFNSKFSLHPGIGLGMERYKFNNNKTLSYDNTGNLTAVLVPGVRKSKLITNYLDIPVELRFSTNPEDPSRSFKVALGFKAGVLLDSYTKVKYKQDGEIKKFKDKQDFNINPFRYGAYFRLGGGNFNFWGYYSLTPLFKPNKGPNGVEITNLSFGISLTGF